MKIIDVYRRQRPVISCEFFPPKTEQGTASLWRAVETLKAYQPAFVSVTYGAMGSTRTQTVALVRRMKHDFGIEAMAHVSCVGASQAELTELLADLQICGIENVLALGGDPPQDQAAVARAVQAFQHANELAAYIKTLQHFCIGGACYPEGHSAAPSKEVDLFYCKKKVEDGVEFLITQLFFDNQDYFDFVKRAQAVGIDVPIVPGIMPITNFTQVKRFTHICGAKIPLQVEHDLTPIEEDLPQIEAYGIAYATAQCRELLEAGAPGLHFYTLNKSRATAEILTHLGFV